MSEQIKDDGGDAFPCTGNPEHDQYMPGMSKRDWFAGMALQGMLANCADERGFDKGFSEVAYCHADAMLKARGE